MMFKDRQDAGKQLIPKLQQFKKNPDAIVLGLPRGGIILSFEIAHALQLPMDLVVPRKIGAPNNPEFAIGAITEDGKAVLDESTIATHNITQDYIDTEIAKEKQEALHRLKTYRGDRLPLDLKDKIAIIVDDGIATGATMLAAIQSVKVKGAQKIIVAVPVTAQDSLKKVEQEVDEVIYLDAPLFFGSVGQFYETFEQTEDTEVIDLMKQSHA